MSGLKSSATRPCAESAPSYAVLQLSGDSGSGYAAGVTEGPSFCDAIELDRINSRSRNLDSSSSSLVSGGDSTMLNSTSTRGFVPISV